MTKQKFASDRKSQQAKASAFKAEKQAQGKFGGPGGAKATGTRVTGPSSDLPSFAQSPERAAQQSQAQQQQGVDQFGAPLPPAISQVSTIQQQPGLMTKLPVGAQPQEAAANEGKINLNQPLGKIATDFVGSLTPGQVAEAALTVGSIAAGGAGLARLAGAGIAKSAAIKAAPRTFESLVKARKLGLFGAITSKDLKHGRTIRDLTPEILKKIADAEKVTIYTTARKFGQFVLNQKSSDILLELLAGFGSAGSLFWRYTAERKVDIPVSTLTSLDTEANNARSLGLYDEADRIEEIKLEALKANKELDNLNVWEVITGKRSRLASQERFEAEEAVSARRFEITKRLRESSTPKQYIENIEKDKKKDLDDIDAEFKVLIESVQTAKEVANENGLNIAFYLKKSGDLDKLKAQKREDIINYYDALTRDFYQLQEDKLKQDHEKLVRAYKPFSEE